MERILGYVESGKRSGANLRTGGVRKGDTGWFVEPTIFTHVDDDMAIAKEEIFGPVLSVMKVLTAEEVIRRGNKSMYGLAAAVWTRDIKKSLAVAHGLKAGTVWVNCFDVFDAAAPFGGFKMSGIGREMGETALDNYSEIKTVTVAL